MTKARLYTADKSSFQGVNLMGAPAVTIKTLGPEDSASIDWSDCAIEVEFDTDKAGGKHTVHQKLGNYLRVAAGTEILLYDHRSGEGLSGPLEKTIYLDQIVSH